MLTATERAQIKRDLKEFSGQTYSQIAVSLTERFGREISRNTVRYYFGSMPDYEGRAKGRPSGSTCEGDTWGQLLPELLALTGLPASQLFRALTHLLEPARLPFGETGFHERTGHHSRIKATANKKRGTLLERCNLRIKVVSVFQNDAVGKRVYLFGYEELTGYIAFDVIPPSLPNARRISGFVKAIEDHLGLPIRRICLIGEELSGLTEPGLFEPVRIQSLSDANTSIQIVSPYSRSAEIDMLQRITRKQNDEVARGKAAVAKEAMSRFVQLGRMKDGVWKSPARRRVMQRLQAEAARLDRFLKLRFKLYRPSRRPR